MCWFNAVWYIFKECVCSGSGKATEIAIGADGSIYALGDIASNGDYPIYYLNGDTWTQMPDGATKIAVDTAGVAWILKSHVGVNSNIYKLSYGIWAEQDGEAKDISMGKDGSVWIIGANSASGGYGIYKLNNNNIWDKVEGGAIKIAVAPNGVPYIINSNGAIYQRKPVFPKTSI